MAQMRRELPKAVCGIAVTSVTDYQARVTRDLVHGTEEAVTLPKSNVLVLQIVKSLDGMGGYRYCLPYRVEGEKFGARFRVIFRECVTNIDYAQNIIVIKTMPGLGAAAGANIDSLKMPNMVGSLSGDDTTLVIMRDKESAAEFCRELHRMLE